jgi:hypothetical protein
LPQSLRNVSEQSFWDQDGAAVMDVRVSMGDEDLGHLRLGMTIGGMREVLRQMVFPFGVNYMPSEALDQERADSEKTVMREDYDSSTLYEVNAHGYTKDLLDARRDKLDWVTQAYGPIEDRNDLEQKDSWKRGGGLTGYDLCEAIRRHMARLGQPSKSVCEILQAQKYVGTAVVFYSHLQRLSIGLTLHYLERALQEAGLDPLTTPVWLDYTSRCVSTPAAILSSRESVV